MSVHTGLNSLTLMQWATDEQKEKYLPKMATGEIRAKSVVSLTNAVLHPWLKGELSELLAELEHFMAAFAGWQKQALPTER